MTSIVARVAGDIALLNLPARPTERLRLALSYPNSKFHFAKRRGWDTGTEPEKIECIVEMPDGTVHVPRGAIKVVREELAKDGYTLTIEDQRSVGSEVPALLDAYPASFPARPYQVEGVSVFHKNVQGIVVLPCAGGKSRLGIDAIIAIGRTALIVVPSNDLVDQWVIALAERKIFAGRIGGGIKEPDFDVIVATDDGAISFLLNDAWRLKFGVLIIDECHRVPAKTLQIILRSVPARWRLGLSATPYRADGQDKLILWSFGNVLLERTTRQLIDQGYLMSAEIEFVETGWNYTYRGPETKEQSKTEKAVVEDLLRNALIADRVGADAKAGETILVLTGRKTHTAELAKLLAMRDVHVKDVTSKTAKGKRKKAIQELREGQLQVMVATSLADEGLDIPRLSRVHLAFPQKARGATVQRLGRLLRKYDKWPKLVDYVDSQVPMFARRAEARKRTYRDIGLLHEEE